MYDPEAESVTQVDFRAAIRRVLRPLVRVMIARGLGFPELAEMLKVLFIQEAESRFGIAGKRMTDSRISLLTGLQRRDIRTHRDSDAEREEPKTLGPIPRVMALWQSDRRFTEDLPRSGAMEPSFETLVTEVGKDVHPRTIFDEMLRLGLIAHDPEADLVSLTADSLIPTRDEAMLVAYYAANLGDHAEAAAENLIAAPAQGPFFERAVHYNQLTQEAAAELEALARTRSQALLEELNATALERQRASKGKDGATERFRVGAFVFRSGKQEGRP